MEWFGMLYPVLRLEKEAHHLRLENIRKERRRKYYRLTAAGRRELEREKNQWLAVSQVFSGLWQSSGVRS
jgi:DNA-binding PadR family transcriptional regulator